MLLLISFRFHSLHSKIWKITYDWTNLKAIIHRTFRAKKNFRASNVRIAVKLPKEAKTDALQQIIQSRTFSSKRFSTARVMDTPCFQSMQKKIQKSLSALIIEKNKYFFIVEAVSNVLLYEDQTAHIPTQRIIIKLKSLNAGSTEKWCTKKFGLTLSKAMPMTNLFIWEIKGNALDAIQISQRLYETGKFQAVEPELINDYWQNEYYQWSIFSDTNGPQYGLRQSIQRHSWSRWMV